MKRQQIRTLEKGMVNVMPKDWMNDPRLNGLDKSKLALLQSLADQGGQKSSPNELLPFLMAAASQGKNQGINFNSSEMELIIEVLKQGQSPQEAAKMNKIINLMKMIR